MKEKVSLQVSELEDEVRTAQGELAEIKEEINNIEDKEIVSVGTASSR